MDYISVKVSVSSLQWTYK